MIFFLGAAFLLLVLCFLLLWNKPVILIYFVVFFALTNDMFISVLHFPDSIHFLGDAVCVYLFILGFMKSQGYRRNPYMLLLRMTGIILFLIAIVSYLINSYSMSVWIIGILQFFRGFAFFFACTEFLDLKEIKRLYRIFLYGAVFNLFIGFIEYKKYGAKWDNNGGLFGMIVGCNGKMNIFLIIVTTIVIAFYMNRKMRLMPAIIILGCCLISSTVSELKIYYIELAICVILTMLFSKMSRKTVILTIIVFAGIVAGIKVLGVLYPRFQNFYTMDYIMSYSTGDYGNSEGSINRLTGVTTMLTDYLKLPVQKVFGIGLGNAHVGTAFYTQYKFLAYYFFYSAYLVTEMGISGLASFLIFFVLVTVQSLKMQKGNSQESVYYVVSAVVALFSFISVIYDAALITTSAYLLYLVLAVPFALQREAISKG